MGCEFQPPEYEELKENKEMVLHTGNIVKEKLH